MSRRNLSLPPLFLVLLMLLSACTPAPVPPAETTASADTASPETTAPEETTAPDTTTAPEEAPRTLRRPHRRVPSPHRAAGEFSRADHA